MKKMVNGEEIEMAPQEIEEFNIMQAAWASDAGIMIKKFTLALEEVINNKAAEKSYSSAISCVSYKESTNPQWSAEATSFIAWRDSAYTYAYDYLAKFQSGDIQSPNIEHFTAGIPKMIWPNGY